MAGPGARVGRAATASGWRVSPGWRFVFPAVLSADRLARLDCRAQGRQCLTVGGRLWRRLTDSSAIGTALLVRRVGGNAGETAGRTDWAWRSSPTHQTSRLGVAATALKTAAASRVDNWEISSITTAPTGAGNRREAANRARWDASRPERRATRATALFVAANESLEPAAARRARSGGVQGGRLAEPGRAHQHPYRAALATQQLDRGLLVDAERGRSSACNAAFTKPSVRCPVDDQRSTCRWRGASRRSSTWRCSTVDHHRSPAAWGVGGTSRTTRSTGHEPVGEHLTDLLDSPAVPSTLPRRRATTWAWLKRASNEHTTRRREGRTGEHLALRQGAGCERSRADAAVHQGGPGRCPPLSGASTRQRSRNTSGVNDRSLRARVVIDAWSWARIRCAWSRSHSSARLQLRFDLCGLVERPELSGLNPSARESHCGPVPSRPPNGR